MSEQRPGWIYMSNGRLAVQQATHLGTVSVLPDAIVIGADIVSSPEETAEIAAGRAKPSRLQLAIPLLQAKALIAELQSQVARLEGDPPQGKTQVN